MPTIKAGSIKKGVYLNYKNTPHLVTKADFLSPGKGSAVMRCKLQNVKTGNTEDFTFRSNENVEYLELDSKKMSFLYLDGADVVFMQPDTYEQVSLSSELLGDKVGLLTPDVSIYVLFNDEDPLGVTFPPKVKLKVTHSEEATAGNTQGQAMKEVELETGLKMSVPVFIKQDEVIVIDTENMKYVSRG